MSRGHDRPAPPALLRVLVLAAVAGALLESGAGPQAGRAGPVLAWPAAGGDGRTVAAAFDAGAILRATTTPPSPAELARLAAAAAAAPLFAAQPPAPPALVLLPPASPVAGRTAALGLIVYAEPGTARTVRMRDAAGLLDSMAVVADATGAGRTGLRVRPATDGWHAWTVEAGPARAVTGARVRPATPPRVLLAAGPPDWESRETARALEEAGAVVQLVQPLGRGLAIGGGAGGLPTDAAALAATDVVIVLAGATVAPAAASALVRHVEAGGGAIVAAASPAATAFGAGPTGTAAATVPAASLAWSPPAEVDPLPATGLDVDVLTMAIPPGGLAVARSGNAPVVALAGYGRGRVALLGIDGTWRWRLEAGRVEAHRAFWRSLVDWTAAGRDGAGLAAAPPVTPPGEPVRISAPHSQAGRPVAVRPGDGRADTVRLVAAGGTAVARVMADRAGVVAFDTDDPAVPGAAVLADPSAPAAGDAFAELALMAHASGGGLVPPGALDAAAARAAPVPTRSRVPWLAGLAMALALAEWTLRRTRGLA